MIRTASLEQATTDVVIARGNFYLARELCDAYFPDVTSVALVLREETIAIVPLARGSAGGLFLKQRNARGDRVIHAQEFIRRNNFLEHTDPRSVRVRWCADSAALLIDGLVRSLEWVVGVRPPVR